MKIHNLLFCVTILATIFSVVHAQYDTYKILNNTDAAVYIWIFRDLTANTVNYTHPNGSVYQITLPSDPNPTITLQARESRDIYLTAPGVAHYFLVLNKLPQNRLITYDMIQRVAKITPTRNQFLSVLYTTEAGERKHFLMPI